MAELANTAVNARPELADPAYEQAILDWARTEAKVEQGDRWIAEQDIPFGDPSIQQAAAYLLKLQAHARKLRHDLGLTNSANAAIARDQTAAGVNLAALMAQERSDR